MIIIYAMYFGFLFSANKGRVYYGLLKEPEIALPIEEDEEGGEEKVMIIIYAMYFGFFSQLIKEGFITAY